LITQSLISEVGWRATFPYLAAIIAFIVLPILLLCVRETPGSMGLEVDNAAPAPAGKPAVAANLVGPAWRRLPAVALLDDPDLLLRHLDDVYGVAQHRAADAAAGFSLDRRGCASLDVGALVFGRVAAGWLIDRYFAPRVAAAFMVPAIVGLVLLATGSGTGLAYVGAALVGLASGAEVDVLAYLTSRYFGLRHFGKIYATFFSAYALGTSVGPIFASWAAQRTSGYELPLWTLAPSSPLPPR
jgi:MFS family permease